MNSKSHGFIVKTFFFVSIICSVFGATLAADVEADLGVGSAYVWRGMVLNDELVMQPSLTVVAGNFSFNVWGNFDLTDRDGAAVDSGNFSEVDLTISWTHSFDKVALDIGVINYMFPNAGLTNSDTTELYVSASLDVVLEPSLTIYYDIDSIDGYYASLGIGHTFAVSDKTEIGLSGSYAFADSGFRDGYFGVDSSGAVDLAAGINVSVAINDAVGFSVGVVHSTLSDSDIEIAAAAIYADDSDTTLSTGFSFGW